MGVLTSQDKLGGDKQLAADSTKIATDCLGGRHVTDRFMANAASPPSSRCCTNCESMVNKAVVCEELMTPNHQ